MDKSDKEKLRAIGEDLGKTLPPIFEKVRHYALLNHRTPDEEKEFHELIDIVVQAKPVLSMLKDFFGNEAFRGASAFYFSMKQKAEEGDTKAKEIVNEFAPLYEQALIGQIEKN